MTSGGSFLSEENCFSCKFVHDKENYLNAEKRNLLFLGQSLFLINSWSSSPEVPNFKVHGRAFNYTVILG